MLIGVDIFFYSEKVFEFFFHTKYISQCTLFYTNVKAYIVYLFDVTAK